MAVGYDAGFGVLEIVGIVMAVVGAVGFAFFVRSSRRQHAVATTVPRPTSAGS